MTRMGKRARAATAGLAAAGLALGSACGGGGGHHAAASVGSATTVAAAPGAGGTAPSTTGTPSAASTGGTGTAGGASTKASASSTIASTGSGGGAVTGAPAPIAAGTYQYHQSGTVTYGGQQQAVPPSGTLVADPANPDRTQVVHREVSPSQITDFTFSFNNGGIFVLSSTQHAGQTAVTCTLNPPLPVPPWPPASGQHFSGAGSCNYAGETISVAGSVGPSTANYAVPGVGARTVWEIDVTITSQGAAQVTDVLQELFSPDLRIPVQTNEHVSGTFGVVQFSSTIQSQLVSGPA